MSITQLTLILFILLTLIVSPGSAIVPKSAQTGTGNDIVWVVLTVGLTLLFIMRPITSMLVKNPVLVIPLILVLIIIYIIIQAFFSVIDMGNRIDDAIQSTAYSLSTFGGT